MTVLFLLVVLLLFVAAAVWAFGRIRRHGEAGDGESALVRLILLALLLGSSILLTTGTAGLLERLFGVGSALVRRGAGDLARDLSFVVVGGLAAALLWAWTLARLRRSPSERRSLLWGVYVGTALTISLVVAAVHAITLLGDLIGPDVAAPALHGSRVLAWGAFWGWHRRVWADPDTRPERIPNFAVLVGSAFGLAAGATGVGIVLGELFGDAYRAATGTAIVRSGSSLDEGIAAAVVGAAVWIWHWWFSARKLEQRGGWLVHTLGVGVLGGLMTVLVAAGSVLFAVLEWWFARPAGVGAASHFEVVAGSSAAAVVGGAVWIYHRGVLRDPERAYRTEPGRAYRYLQAGIGLVAAAAGLGVVVAAVFQGLAGPIAAAGGAVTTLLRGVTAVTVGAPLWATTWRDVQRAVAADPEAELTGTWRRVYLVAVFGAAGVAALVTLVVIAFRLFETALEGASLSSFLDASSTAFGILVASGTVAGYHLAVWRRDRAAGLRPRRRVASVLLVAGPDDAALADTIRRATGAKVIRYETDGVVQVPLSEIAEALQAIDGERVLVVREGDRVRIVPYRPR